MPERDCQRARVYAREEQLIAPRDQTAVAFAQAQAMGDTMWADLGLCVPPKVEHLPQQARCTVADATRLSIRLPQSSPSWLLLHELAHALSSTHDGVSDGHGRVFMGLCARTCSLSARADRGTAPIVGCCGHRGGSEGQTSLCRRRCYRRAVRRIRRKRLGSPYRAAALSGRPGGLRPTN